MGKYHVAKSVERCEKDQNSVLSSYSVDAKFIYQVHLAVGDITIMLLCVMDPIRLFWT